MAQLMMEALKHSSNRENAERQLLMLRDNKPQ